MAQTVESNIALDSDISYDMERLYDNYNMDHVPRDKRLQSFKQRNLYDVYYYKTAVKIFGSPAKRTRSIIAPPMETPQRHHLGFYTNIVKPPTPPVLNSELKSPPEPVKLQTKEEIAKINNLNHIAKYKELIAKRKKLRDDLDSLSSIEAYLSRKKDKSELEKRLLLKYKSDHLSKPDDTQSYEAIVPPKTLQSVPSMSVPPPDGLQILDKFLAMNNMRLMDLFLAADKNKNWSLSRQEFLIVVTKAKIALNESEVDAVFVTLDTNLDDKLTYQELNKGLQLWRKHRRLIKRQSELTETEDLESSLKGRLIKNRQAHVPDNSLALKEQNEGIRDYHQASELNGSAIQSSEQSYGRTELLKSKQNEESYFSKESEEETIAIERSAGSFEVFAPKDCMERSNSSSKNKWQKTDKKNNVNQKLNCDKIKTDLEMSEMPIRKERLSKSEKPAIGNPNIKIAMSKVQPIVSAAKSKLTKPVFDENEVSILNSKEELIYNDLDDNLGLEVLESNEVLEQTTSIQIKDEKEANAPQDVKDSDTKETRSQSNKSSTRSHTSTPNSLEPPESYLRAKSWLPASMEELVEIRKHDRHILNRNKIRRSLSPEKRKAFDELPGVIKIGYKPIDDHCFESTLGGDNAEKVNQFRRWKLKEYYDVMKSFEARGLKFTQKTLDNVLLYPGDNPSRNIIQGISAMKRKANKKNQMMHTNSKNMSNYSYRPSSINEGTGWSNIENGEEIFSHKRAQQREHKNKLNAEDVYPFASSVVPKVHSVNLSSGRAKISRKVDNWMTFEDYCKYTQDLPNRFHHLNKKSNPKAAWPGYLLNKLRLCMDSDMPLVDGHGRQLENRDSRAYEGYGLGIYNGKRNALFRHTAQPKRAYPTYNNDLLTWPVGCNGVRYGNIDEHRIIK